MFYTSYMLAVSALLIEAQKNTSHAFDYFTAFEHPPSQTNMLINNYFAPAPGDMSTSSPFMDHVVNGGTSAVIGISQVDKHIGYIWAWIDAEGYSVRYYTAS